MCDEWNDFYDEWKSVPVMVYCDARKYVYYVPIDTQSRGRYLKGNTMTRRNMNSTAASSAQPAAMRNGRKSRTVNRTITLATMIADIHRDRKNATITAKKARVYLRANHASIHERNAGWAFTQSEYDTIRAHFDPAYGKPAKSRKSRAKSTPAPANADA